MSKVVITEKELALLKVQFIKTVEETAGNPEAAKVGKDDKNSIIYKNFSLNSDVGKDVYKSFTESELIRLLQAIANKIGHSPSQGEVLWVLRDYLKLRFEKWPYALNKAGLSKSAGSGGTTIAQKMIDDRIRNEALDELRKATLEAGHIPHPRHVPELTKKLKKFYDTWGEALSAAGISPDEIAEQTVYKVSDVTSEYQVLLDEVKKEALKLGRAPMHTEITDEIKLPLLEKFGSWRNVLYQLELEPVIRISPFDMYYLGHRRESNRTHHSKNLRNCYYKLIAPNEETKRDLDKLKLIIEESGKIPEKEDVDPLLRKRLIIACSSWNNVLYQLGIKREMKKKKHNIKRKKLK